MSGEETRTRILDAAAAEFAEKGYAGATTRGIAARAGVNEVTLFRHFGTKQDLFNTLLDQAADAGAMIEGAFTEMLQLPPREALTLVAQQLLAYLTKRITWVRLHVADAGGPPRIQKPSNFRLRLHLADYFRARQAAGELRPDMDAGLVAEAFVTGIAGFVISHYWLFPDEPAPVPEAFLQTMVDLFLRGIEGR